MMGLSFLGCIIGIGVGAVIGIIVALLLLVVGLFVTVPGWLPLAVIVIAVIIGCLWGIENTKS